MLTPDEVNGYAGLMAAPWDELNERILRDMVRRIIKAGKITSTAEWQSFRAQALGASRAYLLRQMQAIVQELGPQEAAVFAQAIKQAYTKDMLDAAAAGRALAPLGESEEAQQLLESGYRRTMNTLYNLTQTRAVMGNQNMMDTTQRQLAYYLDMAHMDARTGDGGQDLTNHSWWQGQIVSRSGRHGYLSLDDIGYGDVRGFMGANCAHNWAMYWEGASVRSYTPERLAAINAATVTYNGKDIDRYKATQMQRAQERQIRADKRAFLVAKESGQKDAEKAAAAKLAASRAKMKDFLSQTGLQQYQLRESVPGFGRSEAASAAAQARK